MNHEDAIKKNKVDPSISLMLAEPYKHSIQYSVKQEEARTFLLDLATRIPWGEINYSEGGE